MQRDVQIDRPTGAEIAKCTLKPEKVGGKSCWVIRDGNGQIIRQFADTNGDKVVDQWSYFKDGIEVYRDIDTNANRLADQFRWLNTGGTRWGIDSDEDGKIDFWKTISAEEVTAEVVAALRDHDAARFNRLLLTKNELKSLGIGAAKAEQLVKLLDAAPAGFAKLAAQQKLITSETKWASLGGSAPGLVPAGTEDSTADLIVYENVAAMMDTAGKPQAITVGTLIKVKDVWRLIDVPQIVEDPTAAVEPKVFFFAVGRLDRPDQAAGRPNEKTRELLAELDKLADTQHERRAELLEQLAEDAENAEMRSQWYKQLAETLSAAVQTGAYDGGIARLQALYEKFKGDQKDEALATYVRFRLLTAEHAKAMSNPKLSDNFANIQTKWIDDLKAFIQESQKSPDSAEAMMELAIAQEFGGDESEALKWYEAIVKDFPASPVQPKAKGAKLRLSCVGHAIPLTGKLMDGKTSFDLSALKKKVVLVQYWASWCEPYKPELPLLKELYRKYGKYGFEIVGVCLDSEKKDMIEFIKDNAPSWPQLWEEGGLNNRFANEMGIQIVPTMILIDQQGNVVDRNISAQALEGELKKLLK